MDKHSSCYSHETHDSLSRDGSCLHKRSTDHTLSLLHASIQDLATEVRLLRSAQVSCAERLHAVESHNHPQDIKSSRPAAVNQARADQCGASRRYVMYKPLPEPCDGQQAFTEQQFLRDELSYPGYFNADVDQHPPLYYNRLDLSSFTGAEDWRVWFAKFTTITTRFGYTDEDKLTELLQLIDGPEAEFVFKHLPVWVLGNYMALTDEISMQYRVVKLPKYYSSQFTRRDQSAAESVEEYAAELKSLYSQAFPHRD